MGASHSSRLSHTSDDLSAVFDRHPVGLAVLAFYSKNGYTSGVPRAKSMGKIQRCRDNGGTAVVREWGDSGSLSREPKT